MIKRTLLTLTAIASLTIAATAGLVYTLQHDMQVITNMSDCMDWEQLIKDQDVEAIKDFLNTHSDEIKTIPAGTTCFFNANPDFGYIEVRVKGSAAKYLIPYHLIMHRNTLAQ